MLFAIARTLSFQKWARYQADLLTFFIHIILQKLEGANIEGEMGFCLYFLKYLAQYSCFEIIKYRVSILKISFLKIKFQCNSIF